MSGILATAKRNAEAAKVIRPRDERPNRTVPDVSGLTPFKAAKKITAAAKAAGKP